MRKRSLFFKLFLVLLFGLGGVYLYLFGGPFRFAEADLDAQSLEHLHRYVAAHPESVDDLETQADEYFHGRVHPSDRPHRSELEFTSHPVSDSEKVVQVIDRKIEDDSISATCNRLTFQRTNGVWVLVKRQWAHQTRNRIGWNTDPAS